MSPVVTQDARASGDDGTWGKVAVIGLGAASGAAIGTAIADGPGAVVGAGLGAVLSWWAVEQAEGNAQSAFDNEAQAAYANSLKNVTDNYVALAHAAALNSVATMNLTDYFFARKAEWGAKALYDYQTANGLAHVYNADYVLSKSMVANGSTAFIWQTCEQYTAIMSGISALSQSFVGTYDGMSWGIFLSDGASSIEGKAASSYGTNALMQIVFTMEIETAAGKYVFVPAESELIFANVAQSEQTSTIVIRSPSGEVYNESLTFAGQGVQTLTLASLGLDSGRYNIVSSDSDIKTFGTATEDIANSGYCDPAVVVYAKDGENAKFLVGASTQPSEGHIYNARDKYTPYNWVVDHGKFNYGYLWFGDFDTAYLDVTKRIYLATMLNDINAVQDKTKLLISTANAFGQSYYNLLVANGGQGNPPAPDIIFPDPNQMENLTAQQVYAIYMAYLNQMKDWFYNYTVMDPGDVTLSGGSLDLLCRGAIYDENGVMLYDNNTIFTPYVSIEDWTIRSGQNNTMTQPAFIMIWGSSTSLEGFTTSTNMSYLPTKAGYNLSVEEMYYRGLPVEEQELTVTTVELVIGDITGQIDPPQGITDLSWLINHWFWFAIAFGACFLAGGAFTRNWIIALIGIILVLAGLVGWLWYDSVNPGGLLSGLLGNLW